MTEEKVEGKLCIHQKTCPFFSIFNDSFTIQKGKEEERKKVVCAFASFSLFCVLVKSPYFQKKVRKIIDEDGEDEVLNLIRP